MSAMKQCSECLRHLPTSKFNEETAAKDVCFGCRVKSVNVGFGGYRSSFHGDSLVGGTLKSDNDYTVKMARSQGHDPVPVSRGVSHGLTANQTSKLKTALGG